MAKGIGLIGNFKGKVGNMVGYKNSGSNTANTQGIRVYQPIVKNPKTAAQAEQRAKLAPINATYRALKMIIDRGNEGLPYGNKSRLAWLKQAFKAEHMPWIKKGKVINAFVICPLTKGSLSNFTYNVSEDTIMVDCNGLSAETTVNTVGGLSTALKTGNSFLKDGDQVTFVACINAEKGIMAEVFSVVIDTTSVVAVGGFQAESNRVLYNPSQGMTLGCIIISREGTNGEHLRSTTSLVAPVGITADEPYDTTSKTAAIESYMNSAAVNSDWAEESIQ